MRIGVVFPQIEFPCDPAAIRDFAQTAEGLGFSHILAYDHVLGVNPERPGGWQGPYTFQNPFEEPLTLFSFMAALTEKIEFTSGIIILPQRQTALFAKQAATLDVLSGGRLRIGIGLGWNAVEYEALNENFFNRGRRIEEQVEVLRQLWIQPLVTFTGRWHTITGAGLNPLPVQRPIPLWFGGHAEPVLKRAARLGDGWMPNYRRVVEARQSLDRLNSLLELENRSRNEFGLEVRLPYGEGDIQLWQTIMQEWQPEKVTHFSLNTMGAGFETPAKHLDAIRKFAEALGIKA